MVFHDIEGIMLCCWRSVAQNVDAKVRTGREIAGKEENLHSEAENNSHPGWIQGEQGAGTEGRGGAAGAWVQLFP